MKTVMLVMLLLSLVAAGVCGVLGFFVYPAQRRKETGDGSAGGHPKTRRGGKKKGRKSNKAVAGDPLQEKQGLSRAFFAVFAAGAAAFAFFWVVMPD